MFISIIPILFCFFRLVQDFKRFIIFRYNIQIANLRHEYQLDSMDLNISIADMCVSLYGIIVSAQGGVRSKEVRCIYRLFDRLSFWPRITYALFYPVNPSFWCIFSHSIPTPNTPLFTRLIPYKNHQPIFLG